MSPSHSHLGCFLLIMAGLVPLVSLAPATSLMQPHCADKEMACFINGKCKGIDEDPEVVSYKKDLVCDAHLEIRPYSDTKALIRLKTSDTIIKVSNKGEPTPLFGCELFEGTDGKTIKSIDNLALLHSELLKPTGLACEFIYERSPALFDDKIYEIEYGKKKIDSQTANQFWNYARGFKTCDISLLDKKFDSDGSWIYTEPDKRFNKVVCKAGEQLVHESGDGVAEVSIECKEDTTLAPGSPEKWKYDVRSKKDGSPVSGAPGGKVGCRSKGCKTCPTPETITPCEGCQPHKEEEDEAGCDTLKCEGDRIRIDKANATIGSATCGMHGEGAEAKYRWLLNAVPFDKVGCAPSVSCQDVNPLSLESPGIATLYSRTVKCSEDQLIQIESTDKPTKSISCDEKTGKWTTSESVEVASGAKISCKGGDASQNDAPSGASLGMPETIAIGVCSVVIVAVILLLCFCFVYKPKKRAKKDKKIKTATESRQEDDNMKTALPVGFRPPLSNTASDNQPTPIKVEIQAELVEKTMIAHTPAVEKKSESRLIMDTAILPATTPSEDQGGNTKEVRALGHSVDQKNEKLSRHDRSDGSEPPILKIDKNGEAIIQDKKKKKDKKGSEADRSSHSEAGATGTRKEEKAAKPPVDKGPQPRVFELDAKEEKIRKGATVKPNDYPTLAEIDSDWDDYDHAKALAAGNVEAGKKKRGKTTDKTVPTAVTPEMPPSVERTQAVNTRNTAEQADMENLVTQLDTTVEQKEADGKKK